jgi:hypothetical protein
MSLCYLSHFQTNLICFRFIEKTCTLFNLTMYPLTFVPIRVSYFSMTPEVNMSQYVVLKLFVLCSIPDLSLRKHFEIGDMLPLHSAKMIRHDGCKIEFFFRFSAPISLLANKNKAVHFLPSSTSFRSVPFLKTRVCRWVRT